MPPSFGVLHNKLTCRNLPHPRQGQRSHSPFAGTPIITFVDLESAVVFYITTEATSLFHACCQWRSPRKHALRSLRSVGIGQLRENYEQLLSQQLSSVGYSTSSSMNEGALESLYSLLIFSLFALTPAKRVKNISNLWYTKSKAKFTHALQMVYTDITSAIFYFQQCQCKQLFCYTAK